MNDDRFHELLNLHLDHEATPAESAELEAELRRDPARRRHYHSYCRMQRACAQIFERGCAEAPASFGLEQNLREVAAPKTAPARRVIFPPVAAFAGFGALAACAVFVLMRQAPPSANTPALATTATVVTSGDRPSAQVAVAVANAGVSSAGTRPSASLASHAPSRADAVSLNAGWDDAPSVAGSAPEVAALMAGLALPPVQPVVVTDLVVEPRPAYHPAATTLQAPRAPVPAVQFISFQFQR